MNITQIAYDRQFQEIVLNLKQEYSKANSVFTTASPYGQILEVITSILQLNTLNVQNVQRSFDLNDTLNQNKKTIRSLAKIGQYNPSRGQCASGSIKVVGKQNVNISEEIGGTSIIFSDNMKLKNINNNLDYILDLNQETVEFSTYNNTQISLTVVQGNYKQITFSGGGDKNQSFVIPSVSGKEIDNYKIKVYYNSQLLSPKKHKFDMLKDELAYVPLTSFSGGVDILFGNGDDGFIPEIGSIITVFYLITDGQEGNLMNTQLNDFRFIDQPKNEFGDEIDIIQIFDIDIETEVNFGNDGESSDYLKSILPYVSSNFVLAGPDQYKFFLKRLGIFSLIDVYVQNRASTEMINSIYTLAKKNIELLENISTLDNTSVLKVLVEQNLKEIQLLRKLLLSEGGENLINIFLVPDIKIFYGKNSDINYFNVDINAFLLDTSEKQRILNYLSNEGLQIITNEVKIIDPSIKKYVINVTTRIYDDSNEGNIINSITNIVSDYFMNEIRRDRIPSSDIVRIIDEIYGIDSVTVEFISDANETYHKEYIIKSEEYFFKNKQIANDNNIIMNDGSSYNVDKTLGLDPLLGDILLEKDELPLIRGGFTDRYNNEYSIVPGKTEYSPINVLILPEKTKRKKYK
jgi:hypothetical protein